MGDGLMTLTEQLEILRRIHSVSMCSGALSILAEGLADLCNNTSTPDTILRQQVLMIDRLSDRLIEVSAALRAANSTALGRND
jgi:hypothetical protein